MSSAEVSTSDLLIKEKEQNRLREAQMIGEIGNQVSDIVRTQGQIEATKAANEKMKDIKPEDRTAAEAQWRKDHPGEQATTDDINNQIYQTAYNKAFNDSPYGTGGTLQRAVQAATAAVQGLAGGNLAQALTGAAAPYLAGVIKDATGDNTAANAMAHAVLGAITAYASGNNALAGAAGAVSGELMAQLVMEQLYPGKKVSDLTESEKQTISALGTLAAGLAGGLAGDSTSSAVAGAQTGKNAVENNFLSSTSSTKRDELAEQIKSGDKSLETAKKYLEYENADQRSDALMAKFNNSPGDMSDAERAELTSYLRIYAAEMQAQYGEDVTKELITGMLLGQDYLK